MNETTPPKDACIEFAHKAVTLLEEISHKYEIRGEEEIGQYIKVCLNILKESFNQRDNNE